MHEMCKNYNNRGGDYASKNDDMPMCERHEANYIQSEEYQNQDSHDSYSHQTYHDRNDSEKSLTELNNDVRNDLEDFKRCIHSMRTVHWKLFARDDGKTTDVLPKKNFKPINQELQSKTDFEKLMTKFLDDQRVSNMFVKNDVNDMIIKMKQNEKNCQTKIKNMERKMNEWEKSQNISSEQTNRTEPPPPQAHTEQVNAVFTRSEKLRSIKQRDPPSGIRACVETLKKEALGFLKARSIITPNYDTEREKHNKAKLEIRGYEIALESLEARILGHENNELAWGQRWCALQMDDLSNKSETDSENSLTVFEVRSSDDESTLANNRFTKANKYHVVPPPVIVNPLTPRPDISFAGLDEYDFRNKIIESETTKTNKTVDDEDDVCADKTVSSVKPNVTQAIRNQTDQNGQTSQKQGIGFKKSHEPRVKNVVNTGKRVVKPVWDYGKRAIDHKNKHKLNMANSTTKAEYVVAAHCCGQVLWIQNQMMDYGFNFMNTKIHIDNESTICVVKNPVYHSKTKHIEIRHHFIRDCYEKRLIDVLKIHTGSNVVDLLTKGFDVTRISMDLRMDRSSHGKYNSYMVYATGIHNLSDAEIYAGLATLGYVTEGCVGNGFASDKDFAKKKGSYGGLKPRVHFAEEIDAIKMIHHFRDALDLKDMLGYDSQSPIMKTTEGNLKVYKVEVQVLV
ncbi:hypothetical protein Tco_1164626 [Tanacetum coccineum]